MHSHVDSKVLYRIEALRVLILVLMEDALAHYLNKKWRIDSLTS